MPAKKREKAPASVFDATVTSNLQSYDPRFMANMRRTIFYVRTHGHPPGSTYRSSDGLNTGAWLEQCQANPHILTTEQRALLLSIPGVRLSTDPGLPRLPLGHRSLAEKLLWKRLCAWADNPQADPGTRQAARNAQVLREAMALQA